MSRGVQVWLALGLLLIGLISFGTLGYVLIEDYTFVEALYMTVISLTTVGYREVRPLHPRGQLFTVVLLIGGIGTLAYVIRKGAQLLIEGGLRDILEHKRMQNEIDGLSDHVIVCGLSHTGEQVLHDLRESKLPLVLIERDRDLIKSHFEGQKMLWVHGDAREDEVLVRAGVTRARAIVICLMDDAVNVFITLSARELNPDVTVVAQANMSTTESKLRTAGADRVISLNTIGGRRLAATVLRPSIVDFLDVITSGEMDLEISALTLGPESRLLDKSLAESEVRRRSGAIILAIKRDGQFSYNPDPGRKLVAGDVLLALGNTDQIDKLHQEIGN